MARNAGKAGRWRAGMRGSGRGSARAVLVAAARAPHRFLVAQAAVDGARAAFLAA
jgi:hypothetical protein